MFRILIASALLAFVVLLSGCPDEESGGSAKVTRTTEAKATSPVLVAPTTMPRSGAKISRPTETNAERTVWTKIDDKVTKVTGTVESVQWYSYDTFVHFADGDVAIIDLAHAVPTTRVEIQGQTPSVSTPSDPHTFRSEATVRRLD